MTHVDPHAVPPDDGSDHHPQHPDDGRETSHHNPQTDHGHDDSGWGYGETHHDHGVWEQGNHSHTDSLTADEVRVDADGSLEIHADQYHGNVEVGDYVDVQLPNGDHVTACVSATEPDDHTYRAVVSASDARSFLDHVLGGVVEAGSHVAFEHLLHAAESGLCHGEVIGTDGQHLLIGGADAGAESNGAPVFDDSGQLVGQVVGFDPTQGVNLMVTADAIMSGLADFAGWVLGSIDNI